MRRYQLLPAVVVVTLLATAPHAPVAASGQTVAAAPKPVACSLVWDGQEDAIEKFLAEGKIEKMEAVPIGVTKPQRATLEPGGPAQRFAWKQLTPGYSKGYMESYKAEIAAYKLDRMLDLHMVPPIVERKIDGKNGAAVLWVENTKGWSVKRRRRAPSRSGASS